MSKTSTTPSAEPKPVKKVLKRRYFFPGAGKVVTAANLEEAAKQINNKEKK